MKKKKALGRGLSSFISEDEFINSGENNIKTDQLYLPIEYIKPNPDQPRKIFDTDELKELASTINQRGILQPLIVTQKSNKYYEIVAGERRWRAAQLAQIHEIPVIIKSLSDKEKIEIAIIENVQRSELKPLEEAEGYLKLVNDYSYSHEKVSKLVGKSRPYVSNSIRILSLPIEVKKLIKTGFLTFGHARALLNCNDAVSLSNLIVKKGLSVRQTELLAKRDKIEIANKKAVQIKKDLDTKLLEDELTAHLKFKVNIHADKKNNKGKINIQYNDNEELQTICEILKKQF